MRDSLSSPSQSPASLSTLLIGKGSSCFLCSLLTSISLVLVSLLAISAFVFVHNEGDISPSLWVPPPPTASGSTKVTEPAGAPPFMVGSNATDATEGPPLPHITTTTPPGGSLTSQLVNLDPNLERIELGLARARAAIRRSVREGNQTTTLPDPDYIPRGKIYRNARAFHRSYLEMEKTFKVYVYEEGEQPLFHDGPCNDIYSMEGRFIYNMDVETKLRTHDPEKAHVHFLPLSITKMIMYIYQRTTFDVEPVKRTIRDYIEVISQKYPYWNRSLGADHFLVTCHDWGPRTSAALPYLYSNSIRVLCNANTSEGFNPIKDVALPEINLKKGTTHGIIGGPPASQRSILAFFAGGMHGPIRPILLQHWKGKDKDMQVFEYLPSGMSYYDMMRKSKYCLCPSGYEVASPRVVEAIYLECVPVTISDHYVLPFSDVLNWKAFSVQVDVKDIPNLKNILASIPEEKYIQMQKRVKMVQRHFVVSTPPKRFDVYHMILHSIWLRRMNVHVHPQEIY